MPNRIIKESICTSDNLNGLSCEEEILFYRLMVNCDDYGRLDARPTILRAKCFPLKIDTITDDDINRWLARLEEHNLVKLYTVEDRQCLSLVTWEDHQQVRAKRSKYPSPNGASPSSANISNQMQSDDSKCPRNPIQSLSESNPKATPENTKIDFNDYVEELRPQYTDLDFDNELKKFHLYWSEGSRKLKRPKFALKNWMDKARTFKEQDGKAGKHSGTKLIPRNNYTRPEDL